MRTRYIHLDHQSIAICCSSLPDHVQQGVVSFAQCIKAELGCLVLMLPLGQGGWGGEGAVCILVSLCHGSLFAANVRVFLQSWGWEDRGQGCRFCLSCHSNLVTAIWLFEVFLPLSCAGNAAYKYILCFETYLAVMCCLSARMPCLGTADLKIQKGKTENNTWKDKKKDVLFIIFSAGDLAKVHCLPYNLVMLLPCL